MTMRYVLALALLAVSFTSCQSSKTAFQAPALRTEADAERTVMLLHDSQSPEPTRIPRAAWQTEDTATPRKGNRR